MQTIDIVITPDGETTETTKGFAGQPCREANPDGRVSSDRGHRACDSATGLKNPFPYIGKIRWPSVLRASGWDCDTREAACVFGYC